MGHYGTFEHSNGFFLTNSSFSATGQSITARCGCTFLALNDLGVCRRKMAFKLSSRAGSSVGQYKTIH